MAPDALSQVLRQIQNYFPMKNHPEILVGLEVSDDAAIYKINDELAIIHTVDFFTPVVDDPYDYGAIAAANAMSDVYAMGGEVTMALNICGFPTDLPPDIISQILIGGTEKVAEAGGVLVGGHTVDDPEPKYGLSVMGLIHPQKILTKAAAQPGDILVLTKPLGVGMITTAFKGDMADPDHVIEAVEWMKMLNRQTAQLIQKVRVNACTDVTGFSLLGHGYEIAEKSQVQLQFNFGKIPFVAGAKSYAEDWLFPGGSCRNQRHFASHIQFDTDISEENQLLLFTPETSGGLLISVPPAQLENLQNEFVNHNQAFWIIGEVTEGSGIEVLG